MHAIGEEEQNKFFSRDTKTIDLRKIFQQIDPRKLKRTSSAVWRTPPRFTMAPSKLETTVEHNEHSSDEE